MTSAILEEEALVLNFSRLDESSRYEIFKNTFMHEVKKMRKNTERSFEEVEVAFIFNFLDILTYEE